MNNRPFHEVRRRPFDAFQLALFFPGLGQVYSGRLKRGLVVAVAEWLAESMLAVPLWQNFHVFLVGMILIAGVPLFGILDAIILARKTKRMILQRFNRWYVYAIWIVVSYALLFTLWTFVKSSRYQTYRQPTGSMEPTILPGELMMGDKGYYRSHPIFPGDVIVVRFKRDPAFVYIRRCIALPGQVVQFRDRILNVDGKTWVLRGYSLGKRIPIQPIEFHDPNIVPPGAGNSDNYGPVTVPANTVFVVADDIANGLDSRQWGFVDQSDIVGKALYIYFSPQLERWGTPF